MPQTRRTRRARYVGQESGGSGLLNGLVALILVGAAGALGWWVYTKHKEGSTADSSSSAAKPGAKPRPADDAPTPRRGEMPPPPPPVKPQLAKVIGELNLAVMHKEYARYKGDASAERSSELTAANHRSRLERLASGESFVPDHLEPQDHIVGIGSTYQPYQDLSKLSPADASARIGRALQKIPAATQFKCRVRRGGSERDLFLYFDQGAKLADARIELPQKVKITRELTLDVQNKFYSLPHYYQETYLTGEEKETLKRILRDGEATPEEYAFLTRKVLRTAAIEASSEQDWFRRRKGELEAIVKAVKPADYVFTKDGRRYEGQIQNAPEEGALLNKPITILTPLGKYLIPAQDLKDVRLGKDIVEEFKSRMAAGATQVAVLQQTVAWAREMGLSAYREYAAYAILVQDANDRVGRLNAGYFQGTGGKWVLDPTALVTAQTAVEKSSQEPETKQEMQARLERMGFVFRNGKWLNKTPWRVGFDSLYNMAGWRWASQDCQLVTVHEGVTPLALLNLKSQDTKTAPRLRILAPSGRSGSVSIPVDAPNEIFECEVKATMVVFVGLNREKFGKGELLVTPEGGGKPVTLYSGDEGGTMEFYNITPVVKGKRRFTVTAYLATTIDRFAQHGGYARFLPSLPDTKEIFAVRGTVLVPAPDIDAMWAKAR